MGSISKAIDKIKTTITQKVLSELTKKENQSKSIEEYIVNFG